MKTRRPAEWRRRARQLWGSQRARLALIARGELEPLHEREHYYLWALRGLGRANPADFILPGPLCEAERFLQKEAELRTAATPPPNPAIMPAAAPPPEDPPCPPTPPKPPASPS